MSSWEGGMLRSDFIENYPKEQKEQSPDQDTGGPYAKCQIAYGKTNDVALNSGQGNIFSGRCNLFLCTRVSLWFCYPCPENTEICTRWGELFLSSSSSSFFRLYVSTPVNFRLRSNFSTRWRFLPPSSWDDYRRKNLNYLRTQATQNNNSNKIMPIIIISPSWREFARSSKLRRATSYGSS